VRTSRRATEAQPASGENRFPEVKG
jgi:hypothetical protein